MLTRQHVVDPEANTLMYIPPPSPSYLAYTPASQDRSGGLGVLKYIPIAVFVTMIGLSCLVCAANRSLHRQVSLVFASAVQLCLLTCRLSEAAYLWLLESA